MLGSPEATPYDLRFHVLGIPVRVHPLFWLIMALLVSNDDLRSIIIFIACAFVSVLVHELGHGLSSRLMGQEPLGIVLYGMGGLCLLDPRGFSPWRRIFVLLCGPGAGFLLFGAVLAWAFFGRLPSNPAVHEAVSRLIEINLVWGVLNLLPLWPLDGGQITSTVLTMVNRRNGARWAHVVSLLTAGGLATWLFTLHDYWMAVWFGYFGFVNYQMLRTLHDAYTVSDAPDWWRR